MTARRLAISRGLEASVDPQRLHSGADISDMRDRVEAVGGELDATYRARGKAP